MIFRTRRDGGIEGWSLRRIALRIGMFAVGIMWLFSLGGGSAARAKEIAFDFCPPGSLGEQCNGPHGVAINETGNGGASAGTVYVLEPGNLRVQSFDPGGNFLRTWGWDVATTGGVGFEVCEVAAACKAGVSGGGAGQFATESLFSGVAVNQATGDVYVVDRNNFRIQQFTATGAFVRTWGADVDSTGGTGFEVCEVAANCKQGVSGADAGMFGSSGALSGIGVDSTGNVYVADSANKRVQKFSSAGAFLAMGGWDVDNTTISTEYEICVVAANCKAGSPGTNTACQYMGNNPWYLAVSPTGDVYAADQRNKRIYHLTSTLGCAGVVPSDIVGLWGPVAVGSADEHLFAAFGSTIYELDPDSGEVIEETPAGAVDWRGLAVNGDSGRMYASAGSLLNGENWIRAFDPVFSVTTLPATNIGATGATLNGRINPAGDPVAECFFEYTELANFEAEGFDSAEVIPCAESAGEIGTASSVQVHADVSGLRPGTPYVYRLIGISTGPAGRVDGAEENFTTLGPTIEATWAEDVGFEETSLHASINPQGEETTYRFEYGDEGPCSTNPCIATPIPDVLVGSDSHPHEVSVLLSNLQPGTTYHYRVVATSAAAQSVGPDRILLTYSAQSAESCAANEGFRVGPSSTLPDCRAYEMVSPPDKAGGDIIAPTAFEFTFDGAFRQAARDGSRVTYTSTSAFGDAVRATRSNQYLATRRDEGWATHALYPSQGTTVFDPLFDTQYDLSTNFQAFTPDLCLGLMKDHNLTPLSPEAIAGFTNLYVRDNCPPGEDSYEAVTIGGLPAYSQFGEDLFLQARAYSENLSHVVFSALAELESTPAASSAELINAPQIYDFTEGELRLVSVLPGGGAHSGPSFVGSAAGGEALAPARDSRLDRAVSRNGSRIFWTGIDAGARTIYVRVNGAETLPVSEPGTKVDFWTADVDGTKAIYTDDGELIEFDVEKAQAEEVGTRTAIANEVGGVVGASEDLSHIYFTSKEDLAPGAVAGEWNLYLRQDGAVRFIATLAPDDRLAPGLDTRAPINNSSRVSPDGRHLAFMSLRPLTGFDNVDAESGEPVREVFLYDAGANGGAGELLCPSCNPSGARPEGDLMRPPYSRQAGGFGDGIDRWAAAWLPTSEWTSYGNRLLADDGSRLYFNTFDALVPEDVNDAQDIYQWEVPGTGTCDVGDTRYFSENGGCLALISTGRNGAESVFFDASSDGSDVFFTTASNIDPLDLGFIDLYDARVGGGYPPPPPQKPECAGDACQSVPPPPPLQTPASAGFRGPGDPVAKPTKRRCGKGKRKVRRGGKVRCVKKKKRRTTRDRRARR